MSRRHIHPSRRQKRRKKLIGCPSSSILGAARPPRRTSSRCSMVRIRTAIRASYAAKQSSSGSTTSTTSTPPQCDSAAFKKVLLEQLLRLAWGPHLQREAAVGPRIFRRLGRALGPFLGFPAPALSETEIVTELFVLLRQRGPRAQPDAHANRHGRILRELIDDLESPTEGIGQPLIGSRLRRLWRALHVRHHKFSSLPQPHLASMPPNHAQVNAEPRCIIDSRTRNGR